MKKSITSKSQWHYTGLAIVGLLFTLAAILSPQIASAQRAEDEKRFQENYARTSAMVYVQSLIDAGNWKELGKLVRNNDRSPILTYALAQTLFKSPTYGPLFQLQRYATEHGSPELITEIAKTGFLSDWVRNSGFYLGADGKHHVLGTTTIDRSNAELVQNIVKRFPESASFDVQRLLFHRDVAQHIPDSLMRQFFSRASRSFLASRNAKTHFELMMSTGQFSYTQTQLITSVMKSGAKIYDAGTTPGARLKYINTHAAPPIAGGACGNLFAGR